MNERLLELWQQDLLPQDHVDYLMKLDCEPKVIYDIGACVLHWSRWANKRWPNSRIILFEAMEEVEFLYQRVGLPYEIGVFSDSIKEVDFYQNTYHPGGNSYYQENEEINPDASLLFNHSIKKITNTIDQFVGKYSLPDLIKIDVQGAELDILKGMPKCLANCKDILIEMQKVQYNKGAPLFAETTEFLLDQGFALISKFSNSRPESPDSDYHFRRL